MQSASLACTYMRVVDGMMRSPWVQCVFVGCAAPRKSKGKRERAEEDLQDEPPSPTASFRRLSQRQSVHAAAVDDDEPLSSSEDVMNQRSMRSDEPNTYEVVVPQDARAGDNLVTVIEGEKVKVTIPEGAMAGDVLTFEHLRMGSDGRRRAYSNSVASSELPSSAARSFMASHQSFLQRSSSQLRLEPRPPSFRRLIRDFGCRCGQCEVEAEAHLASGNRRTL